MDGLIVVSRIVALSLVMAVGWIGRRRGYLGAETTTSMGRFVVDIALPCLVFVQMLRTVERQTLRADLAMLGISAAVMLIALGTGWAGAAMVSDRKSRGTSAFLVGVPNWIYLPLPIAEALFGDGGLRAVLIGNISAQLLLWTVGVATLRGRVRGAGAYRQGILNPGILAAVGGIGLALAMPSAGGWTRRAGEGLLHQVMHTGLSAMEMLGSLTVPLSLLVIGAQLGGLEVKMAYPGRRVSWVVLLRLLVAPLLTLGMFALAQHLGLRIPAVPKHVAYLIATMPVAVSCSVIAERFDGDTVLSARAIAHSTVLSIATVPLWYWLMRWLDP